MSSTQTQNTHTAGILHVRYALFINDQQKNVRTSMPYDTTTTGRSVYKRLHEVLSISDGELESPLREMKLFLNYGNDFFSPVFFDTVVTEMRQFVGCIDTNIPIVFVLTSENRIRNITTLMKDDGSFRIDRNAIAEQQEQQREHPQAPPPQYSSATVAPTTNGRTRLSSSRQQQQQQESLQRAKFTGRLCVFYVDGTHVAKIDVEYEEGDLAGTVLETCCEALGFHSRVALKPTGMALKYIKLDGTPRFFLYDDALPKAKSGTVPELELVEKPRSVSFMRPSAEATEVRETIATQQALIAKLQGKLAEERARHNRALDDTKAAEVERIAVHERYVDGCIAVKECEHLQEELRLLKNEISRGLY